MAFRRRRLGRPWDARQSTAGFRSCEGPRCVGRIGPRVWLAIALAAAELLALARASAQVHACPPNRRTCTSTAYASFDDDYRCALDVAAGASDFDLAEGAVAVARYIR